MAETTSYGDLILKDENGNIFHMFPGIYFKCIKDLATLPALVKFEFTGSLSNTGWTGSSAPYTKAVTIEGIKDGMKPMIDVVLSSTWATAATQDTEWSHIKRIAVTNDTLTFYADAIPAVVLDFQGVCFK